MSDRVQKQTTPGSRLISARGPRPSQPAEPRHGLPHLRCHSRTNHTTTIDGVSIVCPMCGEYDVASAVLATGQLQKLEPEKRGDVLDKARRSAEPGARPVITPYLLA